MFIETTPSFFVGICDSSIIRCRQLCCEKFEISFENEVKTRSAQNGFIYVGDEGAAKFMLVEIMRRYNEGRGVIFHEEFSRMKSEIETAFGGESQ